MLIKTDRERKDSYHTMKGNIVRPRWIFKKKRILLDHLKNSSLFPGLEPAMGALVIVSYVFVLDMPGEGGFIKVW